MDHQRLVLRTNFRPLASKFLEHRCEQAATPHDGCNDTGTPAGGSGRAPLWDALHLAQAGARGCLTVPSSRRLTSLNH
jgi:hypothetical protein